MKRKHVFATFALAGLLGVGVFAGHAIGNNVKEARAEETTVYCKMTQGWWTADGAAIGVHYWGGTSTGTTWPGVRGTEVTTDTGVWSFSVPNDVTGLIFTRVNSSGDIADWGAKTGDLTLPTDGKNLYTITSTTAVWGNPGVTGEWSEYVPPSVDAVYQVKVNGGEGVTMIKDGSQYYAENLSVAAGDVFTFTKDGDAYAASAESATNNNYGSNGIRVAGNVNVYLKPGSGEFWVSGTVAPESTTYYILINNINPVALTDNTAVTENEYYITHLTLAVDDNVSFLYVEVDGVNIAYTYYEIKTLKEGSVDLFTEETATVKTAGTYDIYADMTYGNNKLYVAVNTDDLVRYLDVDGVKHAMTVNPEKANEYYVSGLDLTAGDALTFYLGETPVTTTAKAIHNNNLNADREVLVNAASASVYVDTSANTIWAGGIPSNGYHIRKNGNTLITMTHGDDYEGFTQWYSNSISFAVNDTIDFIDASEGLGESLPVVFAITKINEVGLAANFTVDSGVIKCVTACDAQVYMKLKTGFDEVYFGSEPEGMSIAKAFAQDFIDKIGTACTEPVKATLEAAWATQAANFAAITNSEAVALLKTDTSVEVLNTFRAKYVRVIERRGAGTESNWNINDFMGIVAEANRNATGMSSNDAMLTAIVVSSFASICAVGLVMMIRRKKRIK